jgi:SAM-dependent methyltransferase
MHEHGAAYEAYVGRWSRRVAERFLPWLEVPRGADWVDVGCGTGNLTRAILEFEDPSSVVGVDPSSSFLAAAKAALHDSRVSFVEGVAEQLPVGDGRADAVVAGLAIAFFEDAGRGLREMRRAARAGGLVAGYVWDYAGEMQPIRWFWDAAVAVDPAAAAVDQGRTCTLCRPDPLLEAFVAAGLGDVEVVPIEVPARFQDFDDYWMPFLGGVGEAPRYLASLDEAHRAALRYRLDTTVPRDSDGAIEALVRAWACRGRA